MSTIARIERNITAMKPLTYYAEAIYILKELNSMIARVNGRHEWNAADTQRFNESITKFLMSHTTVGGMQ